jgi:subtilisin-like proprotein convertase family protein
VLSIPGQAILNNVTVAIGSLTHSFVSDLQIELTSPQGTTVRLFDRAGSSGDNLANTVFDDAAATPIAAGTAPFTGSFIPSQPLAAFKGERANGNWTLTVRDLAAEDTGTLSSWSMAVKRYTCN